MGKRSSPTKRCEFWQPEWRLTPFVISHFAALVLIGSWVLPATRALWDQLDVSLFRLLNGSLDDSPSWQLFWAIGNHRAIDLFSGSLAALLMVAWVWGMPREAQNWRAAVLGALAIPVIILPFVAHYVLENIFHYERHSPSVVVDGALRLTNLVPTFVTKDASRYSFPGDHAFVLFSIVLFYWYFGARIYIVISAVMGVVFMLPRLFAGAHWLTDNIIGGAVPALLVTAWVMATPAQYYMARVLLPAINFMVGILPPWLRIPERTCG